LGGGGVKKGWGAGAGNLQWRFEGGGKYKQEENSNKQKGKEARIGGKIECVKRGGGKNFGF